MAVYVDALIDWGWKLGPSCHMAADSDEELHTFAASIGLKRYWVQTHAKYRLHYDLTASRRKLAIKLGAIELSFSEFIKKLRSNKI